MGGGGGACVVSGWGARVVEVALGFGVLVAVRLRVVEVLGFGDVVEVVVDVVVERVVVLVVRVTVVVLVETSGRC